MPNNTSWADLPFWYGTKKVNGSVVLAPDLRSLLRWIVSNGIVRLPRVRRPDGALSGWVRVPVLQTQLSIFDANRFAEGVPQVDDVGDDHAFAFLRRHLLCLQSGAQASFDPRDLRFNQ